MDITDLIRKSKVEEIVKKNLNMIGNIGKVDVVVEKGRRKNWKSLRMLT